jgi:hypothetical protein
MTTTTTTTTTKEGNQFNQFTRVIHKHTHIKKLNSYLLANNNKMTKNKYYLS